jgi:hypothetical protein
MQSHPQREKPAPHAPACAILPPQRDQKLVYGAIRKQLLNHLATKIPQRFTMITISGIGQRLFLRIITDAVIPTVL